MILARHGSRSRPEISGLKFEPVGAEQTHPENKGRVCYHLLSHDFKYWNMAAGQMRPRTKVEAPSQDAPQPLFSPLKKRTIYFIPCHSKAAIWGK